MGVRSAAPLLAALFLLSGASALLFETLWLRLLGLAFGNGVWASSLVLSSFMAGLALGSRLAPRLARRWPASAMLRGYALLELSIGAGGLALVAVLPAMSEWLLPLLRPLLQHPAPLHAARLLLAFLLLLLPASAMGATLPVALRALSSGTAAFGQQLGLLYAANTLGAMAGALLGELLLVERLGVLGTAAVAAGMNLVAALGALALAPRLREPEAPAAGAGRAAAPDRRLLAAACACGALLLALEVVWFRFLRLFAHPSSTSFAWLLATVLLGIALGGALGGALLRWRPDAAALLPAAACLAGSAVACCYAAFATLADGALRRQQEDPASLVMLSALLMLPTCVVSGLLFTWLGAELRGGGLADLDAAARLTFANTGGGVFGSALAGFVLLPRLGIERSLFVLAAGYALVAALGWRRGARLGWPRLAAAALLATCLLLFPFGVMRARFFRLAAERFSAPGTRVVSVREGLTETILYLRRELLGEPSYVRLATDGFSMSSSHVFNRRYMKLFVYWPVALHEAPRRALLISYGVGATLQALVDTRALESIDVVDISREILEESRALAPRGSHPLDDPRVRVHVEDGRFFLLAARERYDLITGEPPPPKHAGIGNLYSREYFTLMRRRLAGGGIATYWLPVYQLSLADAKAIVGGFCEAFPDCSLWTGAGLEWMLAGSDGASGPVSAQHFGRQWRVEPVAAELRRLGFETPAQIGACFLADAPALREWTRGSAPLDDDHPQRLSPRTPRTLEPAFRELMEVGAARARFENSPLIARRWPEPLRAESARQFEPQRMLNELLVEVWARGGLARLPALALARELRGGGLRTLPLWLLDTDDDDVEIARRVLARGAREPLAVYLAGLAALAERDYAQAAALLQEARGRAELPALESQLALAWCLGGEAAKARALISAAYSAKPAPVWDELAQLCEG